MNTIGKILKNVGRVAIVCAGIGTINLNMYWYNNFKNRERDRISTEKFIYEAKRLDLEYLFKLHGGKIDEDGKYDDTNLKYSGRFTEDQFGYLDRNRK